MRVLFISIILFASLSGAATVDELKQEISKISKANTTALNNQSLIRAELDVLIQQLVQKTDEVTADQWAEYSPGAWRQIWSDEADNSPAGSPGRDLDKIYQYVTTEGRAVNYGERILPGDQRITFALEAVGQVQGNVQTTTILKGFSRGTGLESGESLTVMSNDILNETFEIYEPVELGEFPNGPINASADLTIHFLDHNLKIGTSPNVYTGNSELFVLERVSSVK
jgi:hypothetical protein